MTPLERCIREQDICGEYIRSGGPDQRGARQGAEDWIMEEAIIRMPAHTTPSRKDRLEAYAARMRAGLTPSTRHRQRLYTPDQRRLIADGVPESFFRPPDTK